MFRNPQAMAAARRTAEPHLNKTATFEGEVFAFWSMAPNHGIWFTNGKRFIWQSEDGWRTHGNYVNTEAMDEYARTFAESRTIFDGVLCADYAANNPSAVRMFPGIYA